MSLAHSCRVFLVCLLMLWLGSVSASSQRKKLIAVLDFDVSDVDAELANRAYDGKLKLARRISDTVIAKLISDGTVQVIERRRLEMMTLSLVDDYGRVDRDASIKFGSALGVDAIVIGNVLTCELQGLPKDKSDATWKVTDMLAKIVVNFRIVNLATGVIEASQEVIGWSPQSPPKSNSGANLGNGISGNSRAIELKDEQIRGVIQLAIEDAAGSITKYIQRHFGRILPTAAAEKQINGRVIDVTGSSLIITNISKSTVHVGDRLYVRRSKSVRDPLTGKETQVLQKVGEVEIIEIQDEVIVGSFAGSVAAQSGDTITNSPAGTSVFGAMLPATNRNPPETTKLPITAKENGNSASSLTSGNSIPKLPRPLPTPKLEERYPIIECPDTVFEPNEFAVQIFLALEKKKSLAVVTEGTPTKEGGITLSLPAQPEQQPWKIDVVLSAPDFEFTDGQNMATMTLHQSKDSTRVFFKLKPKPISQPSVTAEISAVLLHSGAFLGQISRTVKITRSEKVSQNEYRVRPVLPTLPESMVNDSLDSMGEAAKAVSQSAAKAPSSQMAGNKMAETNKDEISRPEITHLAVAAPASAQLQTNPPKLAIDFQRKSPDLTILIKERYGKRNSDVAQIIVTSNEFGTKSSNFTIEPALQQWLADAYKNFASYSGRDIKKVVTGTTYTESSYTDALLQGFGKDVYDRMAPELFKSAFWQLADKLGDKFDSIQIISDNPTIPWELMIPVSANGKVRRGFLGAEFNVGRGTLPEGLVLNENPPQWLAIDRLSVIAPKYVGRSELRHQSDEVKMLAQLRGYNSVGGGFPQVRKLFNGTPQGIIHFAGHAGVLPNGSTIKDFALQLEDRPLDVQTWKGLITGKLSAHPFFFFNACHIGQTQRVANFVNGWAPAVLDAGASGYIGALWPINDRGAYEFAAKFYEILESKLKAGSVTVAEVLRQTRKTFSENGSPTFLAYVYYGDPNLTFYAEQPAAKSEKWEKRKP